MHRFFIDPQAITGDRATLKGELPHQIRDVLRLGRGESVVLLDNTGYEYEAVLGDVSPESATAEITARRHSPAEPRTIVWLYQGLLKGAKFELVLQKATELGVSHFVPVSCERSVPSGEFSAARFERWRRIIAEAAEQSRRGKLPRLLPVTPFPEACRQAPGFRLMPWEEEKASGLHRALEALPVALRAAEPVSPEEVAQASLPARPEASPVPQASLPVISIFIGPEGGFTHQEAELAKSNGIVPVSLGPRILRAETAALAVVAAVLYDLGEMEPSRETTNKHE